MWATHCCSSRVRNGAEVVSSPFALAARLQERLVVVPVDLDRHRLAGAAERSARYAVDRKHKHGGIADAQRQMVADLQTLVLARVHQARDAVRGVHCGRNPPWTGTLQITVERRG